MATERGWIQSLEQALDRRAELIARPDLDAYRLLHDRADTAPGLVIERFGPVLIVQLHQERLQLSEAHVRMAAEFFHERLGTRAVYRKYFIKDRSRPPPQVEEEHDRAEPWIGQPVPPEIEILENGLRLLIRPYDGFSTGLFLEHRDNRQRIRLLSAGKRVLNTFSYTCAFSVASAMGGAASTDSVDIHKRYLEWGRANFAANGLDTTNHWFFCSDVLDFYRRAKRQHRVYDIVIIDPPTFARLRRPKRDFNLEEQLEPLCEGAMQLLAPGGRLLLSTNNRELSIVRLETAIRSTATHPHRIEHLPLPPDFSGDPDYSKSLLVTLTG